MLPPWSTWWGEEAMRDLVPDEALRALRSRATKLSPMHSSG
jgi:hypothetical protein